MATKEQRKKPKDLTFDDIVVDVNFHPQKDVIASGTIDGGVYIHSYSTQKENSELLKFSHHKKSCRVVRFSGDGEELHSASKDKSIHTVDLNTGTLKRHIKGAHESPIYSLLVTGENFLVSGDDDGHIKLWDLRHREAVMDLRESEEFISDMAVDAEKRTLLATSGDGTLTAFNLRRKKLDVQSELFDSEFLSLAIMKRGTKVVCGCGMGELNIFNWGEWGNMSDRFPGHPLSVDCMVPLTDDIVCTGSCDGMIRAVSIQPNRFIGVIGEHKGDFPVENISLSREQQFLASCSHDGTVKFWNMDSVKNQKIDNTKKAAKGNKHKFLGTSEKGDFFADMDDAAGTSKDSDDDSDDDEDEEESDDDNDDAVDSEDGDDDDDVGGGDDANEEEEEDGGQKDDNEND